MTGLVPVTNKRLKLEGSVPAGLHQQGSALTVRPNKRSSARTGEARPGWQTKNT
jgi:hypothetical protein